MLFPTVEFGVFFTIVFFTYWIIYRHNLSRKVFLILVSFVFYGWWNWYYSFLLLGCCIISYSTALFIQKSKEAKVRKYILYSSITLLIGILVFFKYLGLLSFSTNRLIGILNLNLDIPMIDVLLPVGISFFTFQAISYVVDVYRGAIPASRSFIDVTMYISFFPQLVAGPIVRSTTMLPQIEAEPDPNSIQGSRALLLIIGGLAKKVILANYLATELVDPVFENPMAFHGFHLLIAAYGYAIQIFCDFSAYSDIAIGTALLLGFRFPANFMSPYKASSLADFWRRWHISLSTWLRDYLFLPIAYTILRKLSGRKLKGISTENFTYIAAMLLTMLIGGLWHGAKWTFVVWGAIHGVALGIERITSRKYGKWWKRNRTLKAISVFAVFNFVSFAWIFFRSPSLDSALNYLHIMFSSFEGAVFPSFFVGFLLLIGLLIQFIPQNSKKIVNTKFATLPAVFQGLVLGIFLLMIGAFGPQGIAPFIYFRF